MHDRSTLTRRVLEELAHIGLANMADYVNPDGEVLWEGLTREQTAAVAEFSIEEPSSPRGRRKVKIKLVDKRSALLALARSLGLLGAKTTDMEDGDGEELTGFTISFVEPPAP